MSANNIVGRLPRNRTADIITDHVSPKYLPPRKEGVSYDYLGRPDAADRRVYPGEEMKYHYHDTAPRPRDSCSYDYLDEDQNRMRPMMQQRSTNSIQAGDSQRDLIYDKHVSYNDMARQEGLTELLLQRRRTRSSGACCDGGSPHDDAAAARLNPRFTDSKDAMQDGVDGAGIHSRSRFRGRRYLSSSSNPHILLNGEELKDGEESRQDSQDGGDDDYDSEEEYLDHLIRIQRIKNIPKPLKQRAHASISGFIGMGMTTIMFGVCNIGHYDLVTCTASIALSFGGLVAYICGLLEWYRGNTFAYVVLGSYGTFWASMAIIWLMPTNDIGGPPAVSPVTEYLWGVYHLVWGIYSFFIWICTFRMNLVLCLVFFSILFMHLLLGIGHMTSHVNAVKVGGYEAIVSGCLEMYCGHASMMNEAYDMSILPMFPFTDIFASCISERKGGSTSDGNDVSDAILLEEDDRVEVQQSQ